MHLPGKLKRRSLGGTMTSYRRVNSMGATRVQGRATLVGEPDSERHNRASDQVKRLGASFRPTWRWRSLGVGTVILIARPLGPSGEGQLAAIQIREHIATKDAALMARKVA